MGPGCSEAGLREPGLKVNRSINSSCVQIFFTAVCFNYFEIIQTQNRRLNNTQKTSIHLTLPRSSALGLAKSIY